VILDHEVGVILFTSGTTGRPKGVALTHQGLLAAASASKDALAFDSETTVASPLPMFHVFGQVVGLLASWTAHASLRSTSRFEPQSFLAECVADATVLIAVPAMLDALTALATRVPALVEGHRFRLVVAGGAPLAEASAQRFEAKFGLMPIVGYGMTESSGVISLPRPGLPSVGCGWPIASVEIDVRPLKVQGDAPEGVGELWIKGPHVINAYLGDASAQSNAFDEQGWFNTGDLGSIAPTGELVLAGRSKDMIIRGGYNVFPAEVEAVLLTHPSVSQAAVVGVPDDALGEEIVAYVVATDGTGAAELMEFARSRLALYKYPRSVKFLSAFPMTPAGKVMRHLLPR
jgi:long-chain acyl-CoA synthetase